ncbi:MAG: hypothetical protein ABI647_13070 [Gemmatimonadota bacterium]
MEAPQKPSRALEEIDERLDEALKQTFPASDPVALQPDSDAEPINKEPPVPEDQADGGDGTGGHQSEP